MGAGDDWSLELAACEELLKFDDDFVVAEADEVEAALQCVSESDGCDCDDEDMGWLFVSDVF